MTGPNPANPTAAMPDGEHAELVNKILHALERNLGIRVTAWERVQR